MMKGNRPEGLIYDGIALMQKGRLDSARALFNGAIGYNFDKNSLCAQFLNVVCSILEINDEFDRKYRAEIWDEVEELRLKKRCLEEAIRTTDKALAQLRAELDNVESEL